MLPVQRYQVWPAYPTIDQHPEFTSSILTAKRIAKEVAKIGNPAVILDAQNHKRIYVYVEEGN